MRPPRRRPQDHRVEPDHEDEERQDQRQHAQGNDNEDPPPRQGFRHPHHIDEQRFGKLKFTMPKFFRSNDPEDYLSWALKVDKIFRLHNYDEEKKIAMASLGF